MKFKNLKAGEKGTVECVLMCAEEKRTKNNGVFMNLTVSDGETQAVVKKWNDGLDTFKYQVGQVLLIEISAESYNDALSYIAVSMTESSADPQQFICGAPMKSEDMFNFLFKTAGRCGVYSEIVKNILKDNKEKLLIWGAGHSMHHNIRGGLLYHTYRMTKAAAFLTSVYNKEPSMLHGCRDINTELLVAGTILHDIGKLWELETNQFGASEYTVMGRLMGHAFIGAELVGKYASKSKIPAEDVMLLQHLILSHHGRFEYQAVVLPAIPEAMILHEIDMIDSRMYMFESQANEIEPGTMTGSWAKGLEQNVYRPSWRLPKEKEEDKKTVQIFEKMEKE